MLQDAVLGKRFPETSRTDAKRWLSTAYQDVWGAADWTFAHVTREALAITSGDNTPALPTTFADVIALYDDDGAKLLRLDQERFERTYGDVLVDATVGAPEAPTYEELMAEQDRTVIQERGKDPLESAAQLPGRWVIPCGELAHSNYVFLELQQAKSLIKKKK